MPHWSRLVTVFCRAGLALACGTMLAEKTSQTAHSAQSPRIEGGLIYHNTRAFRIPFNIDAQDRARIREVRLYVSSDLGQSWKLVGAVAPDQASFTFHAERDGEYWFAVRTLDQKNRLFPGDDDPVEPNMRVVVDTTKPTLSLSSMGRRGGRVKVRWEIVDENVNLPTFAIQYQSEGARDWREVPISQLARIGAEEWESGTAAPLQVRASVEDKAGNRVDGELAVIAGVAAAPQSPDEDLAHFGPPPPIAPMAAENAPGVPETYDESLFGPSNAGFDTQNYGAAANPRQSPRMSIAASGAPREAIVPDSEPLLVNSARFPMQYAVDGAGPRGPAMVELWVTRDGGRSWLPQPEDVDRASPYDVDLGAEGTYGLWLVVQSASGLGDRPPQPGDRPMQWVVVDSTPPAVKLDVPRVGHGPALGKVLITWQAADPHLDIRPVLLCYRPADQPGAPWTPITDRLDNTGRYIWSVPSEVPPSLHIRVDVIDRLGNRSSGETTAGNPIVVDRSRPRGRILGLEPGGTRGQPDTSRR